MSALAQIFKRLIKVALPFWLYIFLGFALLAGQVAIRVLVTQLEGNIVNAFLAYNLVDLETLVTSLAIAVAVQAAIAWMALSILKVLGIKVVQELQQKVFNYFVEIQSTEWNTPDKLV